MVPVLSSSSVSTSPAASTARPEVATTLKRTSRSMPAMPIAESRPPIVVGISVTKQRGQHRHAERRAAVTGQPHQRDDRDQEDERQTREQDVERDLVRRLAPGRAFHEGDHAVEERAAGGGGDAHDQPVGDDLGAARHRGAVAARLADHRRAFARDGALVDAGDPLDHLAVATGSGRRPRPGPVRRRCSIEAGVGWNRARSSGRSSAFAIVSLRARRRLSARARPRPSATASAKVANSTVSQSQTAIASANPHAPPVGEVADAEHGHQRRHDLGRRR